MSTEQHQILDLRAADLVHASNIRQESTPQEDAELRASIKSQGRVLQNLIGAPRKTDQAIAIFAGGRRLSNVHALLEAGEVDPDFTVPVLVRNDIDPDSPQAIEIAMSENMVRASMDYIDECNAMLMLSSAGRKDNDIAAAFGYRARTVKERLLIANLIPEAQALVRSRDRDMEWARALTIADKSMQIKICDGIATNANSWKTGDEVRSYLTESTIPCNHALFDIEDYDGIIVRDFFDGDKFADTDKFWELQHKAINGRQADIEMEGFGGGVTVLHEPFEDWRYEETSNIKEAHAFIEVLPDGKVREIRNVKPILSNEAASEASLDATDAAAELDVFTSDIAPFEVRATKRMCEYASAHRTAMLQAHLAGNFRASLEYTVMAFLGVRSASFGASVFQIPGKDVIKTGKAFDARVDIVAGINELTEFSADEGDMNAREAMQVSIIRQMDDDKLQQLFALLVSMRIGQQTRGSLDENSTSLSNIFGADINVRDFWAPNETFFDIMSSEDLRRLATEFLPGASATRFANSKRKNLVRALTSAFEEAQEGALPKALADRLNSWVPGAMSFPAHVVTTDELEDLGAGSEEDLEASIFDLAEDEEIAA